MSAPARRALLVGAGAAAAAAGLGLSLWQSAREPAEPDATAMQPQAALDEAFWTLTLRSARLTDEPLAQFRGRPLVLNFWATWCAPCVRELPALDRFQREFGPPARVPGWQVLGLAIDAIAPVLAFSQKLPVGFPLLIAEAQGLALSQRLGNPGGLPFTVLADAQGRIRWRKAGETKLEELAALAKGLP